MSEDLVTFEVDGRTLQAARGSMLIEATDAAGIRIPRFCYHRKLSVAANCRMCLVEMERAPKAVPACATPVVEGMKIRTRSRAALAAQRATMEFLLINHPLDCPICDQGGECELQDVAMGYGAGVSRFSERKRVVADKDIGPLVATEMTRCIHCTRCVRFGEEIAGLRELGATGRGEHMEIGTFVEQALASELSGNVIDLCPVGALTAKPSRYTGRSWEMVQHALVAPHDSVGSNVYLHSLRGRVMRVVPRDNESINETWISDRDRFSYLGLNADDRALKPLLREPDGLCPASWESALERTMAGLQSVIREHGADSVGVLVSPTATLEEMYLLQKLARGLGVNSLDHRLRQLDFGDQREAPPLPWLGQRLEDLEQLDAALLVGSEVALDQPLVAHRLRKAARRGAGIGQIGSRAISLNAPLLMNRAVAPGRLVAQLATLAAAVAAAAGEAVPRSLEPAVAAAGTDPELEELARRLLAAGRCTVLLGTQATDHPEFSRLRLLAGWIARLSGASFGYLPAAANSVGGWLAGVLPQRLPGGRPAESVGLAAGQMLAQPRRAYLLLGVEPELDCADGPAARAALEQADFVVSLTAFVSAGALEWAHVLLPVAAFGESAGTFVNMEARWQSFQGAVAPPGEARPAWKVLRVLGNLAGLDGFDFTSADQVTDEVHELCRDVEPDNSMPLGQPVTLADSPPDLERAGTVPPYSADALVRRSGALQESPLGARSEACLNPDQARRLGVSGGDLLELRQGPASCTLPVRLDDRVADHCIWVPAALDETWSLGPPHGPLEAAPVARRAEARA